MSSDAGKADAGSSDAGKADAGESTDGRTEAALKAGGFADVRETYRGILRRLKEQHAGAFDEATRRYHESLMPAIAGGEEPVAAWAAYGDWLARKLGPGRLVRLDASGLACDAEPTPVPGQVLLFLPDESGDPAIPILRPGQPSPAQQAALDLLAR